MNQLSEYQEMHNDGVNEYEQILIDHCLTSGHEVRDYVSDCGMCKTLFDNDAEAGLFCTFHPESYFDPNTRFCEECELEDISAAETIQSV